MTHSMSISNEYEVFARGMAGTLVKVATQDMGEDCGIIRREEGVVAGEREGCIAARSVREEEEARVKGNWERESATKLCSPLT